jgi:hypothetical protein
MEVAEGAERKSVAAFGGATPARLDGGVVHGRGRARERWMLRRAERTGGCECAALSWRRTGLRAGGAANQRGLGLVVARSIPPNGGKGKRARLEAAEEVGGHGAAEEHPWLPGFVAKVDELADGDGGEAENVKAYERAFVDERHADDCALQHDDFCIGGDGGGRRRRATATAVDGFDGGER